MHHSALLPSSKTLERMRGQATHPVQDKEENAVNKEVKKEKAVDKEDKKDKVVDKVTKTSFLYFGPILFYSK